MAVDPLAVRITESNQIFVKKVRVLWKLLQSHNFFKIYVIQYMVRKPPLLMQHFTYMVLSKVTILDLCSSSSSSFWEYKWKFAKTRYPASYCRYRSALSQSNF